MKPLTKEEAERFLEWLDANHLLDLEDLRFELVWIAGEKEYFEPPKT